MASICRECGHASEEGQRFCRGCGADLAAKPDVRPAGSVPAVPPAPHRSPPGLIRLLLGLTALSILSAIAVPSYRPRAKESALRRACASNMKTIEGALILFFLEHDRKRTPTPTVHTLRAGGYLKSEPICPSGGGYTIEPRARPKPQRDSGSGLFGVDDAVRCSIHGPLEEPPTGP